MTRKLMIAASMLGLIAFTQCGSAESNKDIIERFCIAENEHDVTTLATLVHDDVTVSEAGFVNAIDKDSYLDIVRWNRVFELETTTDSITDLGTEVVVYGSSTSERIEFLHEKVIEFRTVYSMKDSKIVSMTIHPIDFNLDKWKENYNVLSDWVAENHPDSLIVMNQLNARGAQCFSNCLDQFKRDLSEF